MARRKRYITGKVYKINDHVLVNYSKSDRRIVSLNNDRNNMEVRRIMSLYDKNGNRKQNLIPIEKYPDIPKASGIEKRTFRKTLSVKPIQEKYLTKTKTRLNKWDRKKMYNSYLRILVRDPSKLRYFGYPQGIIHPNCVDLSVLMM